MFNLLSGATGLTASYITLAVYLAAMATIAIIFRRKSASVSDFLLANRGVGGWLTAFAYGATYFSAVVFIGYAGKFGSSWGLAAIWIGIGNAVFGTFVAWKVLARRTRAMSQNLDAKTMADFFAKRYGSPKLKLLVSIVIFVFLVPYSSSVYQGLAHIFNLVFGLDFIWAIVILAVISALYLFFGGYFASSISDLFQGIIMLVGVAVMIFTLLGNSNVNWESGLAALNSDPKFALIPAAGTDLISSPLFNVIIMVLLTSFGIWALPQSIHKFYAIKNTSAIKQGTVISTVFSLIVGGGAYFTGSLISRFTFEGNLASDQLIPAMLKQALPAALLGLIVILLLSASISTLSALSLTSASTVSVDFVKGFVKKDANEKHVSVLMRVLCIVFVLISAVLAYLQIDAIVTMMSLSWGVLAGCFIGPYVLGLYSKKITKAAVWTSIVASLVITLTLVIVFGIKYPASGLSGIGAVLKGGIGKSPLIGVISMAFSMIITPTVSFFTKEPNGNTVALAFKGIKSRGAVVGGGSGTLPVEIPCVSDLPPEAVC
ncbi:MAG: sodium:solute symporter [Clostridiaceae bacterium]|jgi:Na+/proline symporter|nr:sodium:solute symporter [Clostridiaceae bacterium]